MKQIFQICVSLWLEQDVFSSDHISRLLTLHNLPSGLAAATAAEDDYLVLEVHDHRCVIIPLLAEKKDDSLS